MQYELTPSTVVSIGYQGSRGTHLFQPDWNINRLDPFTGTQAVAGYNSRFSTAGIFLLAPTGGGLDLPRRNV